MEAKVAAPQVPLAALREEWKQQVNSGRVTKHEEDFVERLFAQAERIIDAFRVEVERHASDVFTLERERDTLRSRAEAAERERELDLVALEAAEKDVDALRARVAALTEALELTVSRRNFEYAIRALAPPASQRPA